MKAIIQVLGVLLIILAGFVNISRAEDKAIAVASCQDQIRMMDAGEFITILKTKNSFQAYSYRQTIAGPTRPTTINVTQEVETLPNQNTSIKFLAENFELAFEMVKADRGHQMTGQLTLDYPEGKIVKAMDCKMLGRSR